MSKLAWSKVPGLIGKNWILPLVLYGIIWAGFRYWLDFNNKRSIVFAFLFGSFYYAFKELRKKTEKAEDFIPYRVSIRIDNQRDLLFKCNLVKTEDEWNQLGEKVKDTSVFRRGLNFTVLSLNKDGLPHLIWWDDYKTFLAGIPSFEDAIQGLEFPSRFSINGTWSPRLYFGYLHGKGRGYNLAICVRDEWWEKNKTDNIEIENEHLKGAVYLILGTLPYGEIGLDYGARGQDRKTELEKLGWTIKDYHEPEVPAWDSIEVQNEHFSVSQQFCETD